MLNSQKQNETITIVSFTSQNPARQEDLRRGIAEILGARPFDIWFPVDDAAAIEALRDAHVLFTWRFTEPMFRAAQKLEWIHVSGAGVDSLLFPEFQASQIILTNSRGIHGPQMAEWALGGLLYISQQFSAAEAWRRDHDWKQHKQTMTRECFILQGKRALIVGYGAVGQAIAQRLLAIGVRCEGVATQARPDAIPVHALSALPSLLGEFDIVVVALPLTGDTERLFNRDLFSRMKPGSIFVNVARGRITDEAALAEALQNGPLAYAALDVFATEPLPEDSLLFALPNLFMTPHVSGNFPDYSALANQSFLANLRRYAAGQSLLNIVDKQRRY